MQTTTSKVAIFLAAFNGKDWLAEQVDSILIQNHVAVTIFVSVDNSSDGTEAYFDNLAKSDVRIVILPHGEIFGDAAKNFFRIIQNVNLTDFDYVAFADQDDIWLPNKLFHAITELLRTKSDGYSSSVTAFWKNGRQALIEKSQPQVRWDFLFEAAGPGCTYVISKKLALDVQNAVKCNWNEIQGVALHDWFIYAFARAKGYFWFIDNSSNILYRQHEKNQVGVNLGLVAAKYRFKQVMAGWLFDQSLLIARLVGISNHPFVKNWSGRTHMGYLKLALRASHCRRRLRDKFLFAFFCLLFFFVGPR